MARPFALLLPAALLAALALTAAPAAAQEPAWSYSDPLTDDEGRFDHTATRLRDGRVLVAGGQRNGVALATAEVFDPVAETWAPTGEMSAARSGHAAVLLFDGRVLVAGGTGVAPLASAEVYDPNTGLWSAADGLNAARTGLAMVGLLDGSVLATGGAATATAEVYDPVGDTWTSTFAMTSVRSGHTATVLADGRVLVTGGTDGASTVLASTEVMDPGAYTWAAGDPMGTPRALHTATLLPSGDVLVVGGTDGDDPLATAEVFAPGAGTWSATANSLSAGVSDHEAVLLADQTVLVAGGGEGRNGRNEAYRYDPAANTFAATTWLLNRRIGHTLTLLQNGNVLAVGSAQSPDGEDFQTELYSSRPPDPPGPPPKDPTDPGDPCLISFAIQTMPAGPACGPYMFTRGGIDFFAFTEFFTDAGTSSVATEENLPTAVLDGTAGVTLSFDSFFLSAFEHLPHGVGDRRIYTGGTGVIRAGGDVVLRATDGSLAMTALYPPPVGPGDLSVAVGYMVIDEAQSDPDWVAAFDPDDTGMIRLDFSSLSDVGQLCPGAAACPGCFGTYNVSLCLRPLEAAVAARLEAFGGDPNALLDFSDVGIVMDFGAADFSNLARAEEARVIVERIDGDAGGALPGGIERLYEGQYWRFGTTVASFSADVSFDLTGVPGVSDPDNLRLLRRDTRDAPWSVYADIQRSGNTLTAEGVTGFSEWAIGSTGGNVLPVELLSFTATRDGEAVVLRWETASETGNAGFEVQRTGATAGPVGAEPWEVVAFVDGHGTTAETHAYVYRAEGLAPGTHRFRLRQVDFDGTATFSPTVEVAVEPPGAFVLGAAYPDPFNPQTTITFAVAAAMPARVTVFDVLGRPVALLFDGVAGPGAVHRLGFDAAALPSGTYFYRLETPVGVQTRRMLLVR